MSRYNRHIILSEIGQQGQDKLLQAKVLVIGAGGLGCPILQYLAAAGIGKLGLMDFDKVELHNLQRQVLFGASSLGENKALAAKRRLADLNDSISIEAYPERLDAENAIALFKAYDIIVDATDNFESRYLINDAAIITGKPVVFGAIYKFEGQLAVFNYKEGPSYRCLFPEQPKQNSLLNCDEAGVLGVLPGIIGSMQANEVLKLILGIGKVLSGQMLSYNALTHQSSILTIPKTDVKIDATLSAFNNKNKTNCEILGDEISIERALAKSNVQFIDVREPDEMPQISHMNLLSIPLNTLESRIDRIPISAEKIIFCQTGVRSRKAISILKKHKISNCYSLQGGAQDIYEHFNS